MAPKSRNVSTASQVPSSLGLFSLVGTTVTAVLAALLALFQWMELIVTLQGGESFCAISETLNCDAVWTSPFAKGVHARTGLPVAGWGLAWGVTAVGTSLAVWLAFVRGRGVATAARAARLTGLLGVAASIILLIVSFRVGVFCPTCLATYVMVVFFTGFAFAATPATTPGSRSTLTGAASALKFPAAILIVSYGLLLWPGKRTPLEAPMHLGTRNTLTAYSHAEAHPDGAHRTDGATAHSKPADSELGRYLASLPPNALAAISGSIASMRSSPSVDASRYPPRHEYGPDQAPVKIVDFSDLKCSHCKRLDEVMQEIKKAVPHGSFSAESRYYPLDPGCNPQMSGQASGGDSVRCVSAKALICMEQQARFDQLRSRMFAEQTSLSTARVYELVKEVLGVDKGPLEQCVNSAATAEKLAQDIAYAANFPVSGTPIVLVNGKLASGVAPFLYAIILAEGNIDDPAFRTLPPPAADFHGHDH